MRYLFVILLIFFSTPSYSEWTRVVNSSSGNTWYVDFKGMKKHEGYIYFWTLNDYLKPYLGHLTAKGYVQVDCGKLKYKNLSISFHDEPMGSGPGDVINEPDEYWKNSKPKSIYEKIIKSACNN